MRFSLASLSCLPIALALAGCQGNVSAPVAPPPAAAAVVNPTVVCERGCSVGYDSCLDAPQAATANAGGQSQPAQDPTDMCREQLKACLRRCLN
jgi:hypothetical protein